jgi:2-isopropylmalate synthase
LLPAVESGVGHENEEKKMAKYSPFPDPPAIRRSWPDKRIKRAPIWCSVDLRDGNQALVEPMGVSEKLEYFDLLLGIGFKEIEIGFPSASQIEFDFARELIEQGRMPAGVAIQVLCQCREHLVARTFESLVGAKKAIFHIYNSTSPVQRKVTFGLSKAEIKAIAVEGTRLVKSGLHSVPGTEVILEYSPESFSNTEVEYALEVCEAVMDEWGPTPDRPIILNLPSTVESSTPNLYADMIEWFATHLSRRDSAIISLHTHNDRGTGVAASELGLLAGADRVEGTLFGNGERTGNLDIVSMALNMYSQGVDPGLELYDLQRIVSAYSGFTGMEVPPRQPYAGELVYTAFSGSHQDAIKKGMEMRAKNPDPDAPWEVPYLPIDPKDLGRSYEAIIRINSQSGKGGVAYILKENAGYDLPKAMHPEVGMFINRIADVRGKELDPESIRALYEAEFLNVASPLTLLSFNEITDHANGETTWRSRVRYKGEEREIIGKGTGPIEAFVRSLASIGIEGVSVEAFHEDALSAGSDAFAIAYVQTRGPGEGKAWGVGTDRSIAAAGVRAVLSAVNRRLSKD